MTARLPLFVLLLSIASAPAAHASAHARTLLIEGRVVDPEGFPIPNARIVAGAGHKTSVRADDNGRYAVSFYVGGVQGLVHTPVAVQLRAESRGWNILLPGAGQALALELRTTFGPGGAARIQVRSNSGALTSALAESIAAGVDPLHLVVHFVGTPGAAPPTIEPSLDAVAWVPARDLEWPSPRDAQGGMPLATVTRADSMGGGSHAMSTPRPTAAAPSPARDSATRASGQRWRLFPSAEEEVAHRSAPPPAPTPATARANAAPPGSATRTGTSPAATPATPATTPPSRANASVPPQGTTATRDRATTGIVATPPPATTAPGPNAATPRPTASRESAASHPAATPPVPSAARVSGPTVSVANGVATQPRPVAGGGAESGRAVRTPPEQRGVPAPGGAVRVWGGRAVPANDTSEHAGNCGCIVRGTVEVSSDRPLPERLEVVVALEEHPALQDSVELFMGSPRMFELRGVPCGVHRLTIQPLARRRFRVLTPDALGPFDCRAGRLLQPAIVLRPR